MRRVEQLIASARELSQNTRYDANSGISQNVFVQYCKNANDTLMRAIFNSKTKAFIKSTTESVVPNQEEYDYPSDIFINGIDTLEWSDDGNDDFIFLEKSVTKERVSYDVAGYPFGYIPRENDFILSPPLDSGTLRISYFRRSNAPEKRSGKISAVTTSSGNITALTVDVNDSSFDATYIGQDNFLCIVGRDGAQKAKNIEYDSVNSGTGAFTLTSGSQSLGTGSVAVGDYITIGKDTTNNPEFDASTESFFIQYMVFSAKFGDASKWTSEARTEMEKMAAAIIQNYAQADADITSVPITNTDYLMLW